MTKKQRAQVVELLRCSADVNRFYVAAYALGGLQPANEVFHAAWDAFVGIHGRAPGYWNNPRKAFLEAALRVEEGSYP
jgi:hypothetical protein